VKRGVGAGLAALVARTQTRGRTRRRGLRPGDSPGMGELLAGSERPRTWAASRGIAPADDPGSLPELDHNLERWQAEPGSHFLGNETGLYLGTVIVRHVPGARWQAWPNGHPVVRLLSARAPTLAPSGHSYPLDR
jgi:Family of unknown function (DUF6278)